VKALAILLTVVLYIISINEVIKRKFQTRKKVFWIVTILLLPLLGATVYFLVEKKK